MRQTVLDEQKAQKQPIHRSTRMKTQTQFYGQHVTLNDIS